MPSWSRDGHWLYFASNRSGDDQVWRVPATGGEAVQVTKQGGFAAPLSHLMASLSTMPKASVLLGFGGLQSRVERRRLSWITRRQDTGVLGGGGRWHLLRQHNSEDTPKYRILQLCDASGEADLRDGQRGASDFPVLRSHPIANGYSSRRMTSAAVTSCWWKTSTKLTRWGDGHSHILVGAAVVEKPPVAVAYHS